MPPNEDLSKSLTHQLVGDGAHRRLFHNNIPVQSIVNKALLESKDSEEEKPEEIKEPDKEKKPYKPVLIWFNIISIGLLHLLAVCSISCFLNAKLQTYCWAFFIGGVGGFGVTGGAHRLWTHKSYKAKWPLEVILLICYSVAGQNTVHEWVRDHRVHHKFSETDADPHNSNRGFFFSHVGWLMQKKHPEVLRKGKMVDMSDIKNNKLLAFHERYFIWIKLLFCFAIPIYVPLHFWNETYFVSFMGLGVIRYVCNLNFTWLVNSVAHMWGDKPYDKSISPVENLVVSIVALGEGWHNYHHVFPWDYKAAELGDYKFNLTTFWLDQFAKIGWAYDLKTPSKALVKKVAEKYGDGTHSLYHMHKEVDEDGNLVDLMKEE